LGREFSKRTDHSALRWLKHTPEPIGQQARWLERLEEFSYRIEHRPGRKHNNADAMSRRPCRQCHRVNYDEPSEKVEVREEPCETRMVQLGELSQESEWKPEKLSEAYESDEELSTIFRLLLKNEHQVPSETVSGCSQATKVYWRQWERLKIVNGMLYRRWDSADGIHHTYQLIPPRYYREKLLKEVHTGVTGGHLGVKKTKDQLQRRAYWHNWMRDVEQFCRQCHECCTYHRGNPQRKGLLQVSELGEPFERIAIDLTGKHPSSRSGNVYILPLWISSQNGQKPFHFVIRKQRQ